MIDKFTIFREMLDYMAHISTVTDADMNYCYDRMKIVGKNDGEDITIEITITKKEEEKNA